MCKIAQLAMNELEADKLRGSDKLWASERVHIERAVARHTNCNCKERHG